MSLKSWKAGWLSLECDRCGRSLEATTRPEAQVRTLAARAHGWSHVPGEVVPGDKDREAEVIPAKDLCGKCSVQGRRRRR